MPPGIGQTFMEKTHYQYLSVSDQRKGLPQPPLQESCDPEDVIIDLPSSSDIEVSPRELREVIESRVSVRSYANRPLTLAELSYLLWCTQGVKRVEGQYATFRTVPSAGARHALETYVLANRVEGLEPGVYRFLSIGHKLVQVNLEPGIADEISSACWGQAFVKTSAATFLWVAAAYRMTWRYGQRGYRYLHLDAGHACQNLYLAAQSVDSGVCAIAAFMDEELCRLLDLDGKERFVIYVATVGKTR